MYSWIESCTFLSTICDKNRYLILQRLSVTMTRTRARFGFKNLLFFVHIIIVDLYAKSMKHKVSPTQRTHFFSAVPKQGPLSALLFFILFLINCAVKVNIICHAVLFKGLMTKFVSLISVCF